MKKWVFLIIGLLVLAIVFGFRTYSQILDNKTKGHDEAIAIAKEEANVKEVLETSTYARNEVYIVVKGVDDNDTTIYAFVPQGDGDVIIVDASEGLSEEEALQLLQERQNFERILSVQLGIEGGSPAWEITYIDTEDRLTFYYMDFKTGAYLGMRVL